MERNQRPGDMIESWGQTNIKPDRPGVDVFKSHKLAHAKGQQTLAVVWASARWALR